MSGIRLIVFTISYQNIFSSTRLETTVLWVVWKAHCSVIYSGPEVHFPNHISSVPESHYLAAGSDVSSPSVLLHQCMLGVITPDHHIWVAGHWMAQDSAAISPRMSSEFSSPCDPVPHTLTRFLILCRCQRPRWHRLWYSAASLLLLIIYQAEIKELSSGLWPLEAFTHIQRSVSATFAVSIVLLCPGCFQQNVQSKNKRKKKETRAACAWGVIAHVCQVCADSLVSWPCYMIFYIIWSFFGGFIFGGFAGGAQAVCSVASL